MKIVKNVVLGLGALLFAASAFGQGITTGTVSGSVTDPETVPVVMPWPNADAAKINAAQPKTNFFTFGTVDSPGGFAWR